MFDVGYTEFLAVAVVALLVIGPKDLPKAMRFIGHWVGRARGVARQFRSGFDSMVREAELAEMEKKWAEENARILAEHPAASADGGEVAATAPVDLEKHDDEPDLFSQPVMVEKPIVTAGPDDATPAADAKASS